MKRKLAWTGIVLAGLIALAIGIFNMTGAGVVRFDEPKLQEIVNKQLPKKWKGVEVKQATLTLGEKDIRIEFVLDGVILGQTLHAEGGGTGEPSYHDGVFYIHPTNVELPVLELKGKSLTGRVRDYVEKRAKSDVVKDVANAADDWVKHNLKDYTLGLFSQIPIYRPGTDMKGTIIRASLESVVVENKTLVVKFSLLQLTMYVFISLGILALVVLLAFGLLMKPEALGGAMLVATGAALLP